VATTAPALAFLVYRKEDSVKTVPMHRNRGRVPKHMLASHRDNTAEKGLAVP